MARRKPDIKKKIANFPPRPGVYLMKDSGGKILYVGKAASLRKRAQSYFARPAVSAKISVMINKVKDIDYIETPSEVDALLLEAQLVKRYRPRYNTLLKDDKSYPLLKITHEPFPRILVTRDRRDRKATYFGPYTDAKLLHEAVRLLNAIFPIRKCGKMPRNACLYYHLDQCLAPCIKPGIRRDYNKLIHEIGAFMRGKKASFVQYLTERMEQVSREQKYEEAQFYKEQIQALGKLREKRYHPRLVLQGVSLSASNELKRVLKLRKLPERIVCFDVSNIAGKEAVASKVSFYRELPDKNAYRRYKIRTVVGIDDYAMIQEALQRMLRGLKEKREHFVPDLIVIDGGRGHLNSAFEILKKEGFDTLPIIAIAKRFEEIHALGKKQPLILPDDSPALHLIKRIRDEAHRFAIGYYHILKEKGLTESFLDSIPGVGAARKRMLLRHFSSVDELKDASVDMIAPLPGMNRSVARRILDHVRS